MSEKPLTTWVVAECAGKIIAAQVSDSFASSGISTVVSSANYNTSKLPSHAYVLCICDVIFHLCIGLQSRQC